MSCIYTLLITRDKNACTQKKPLTFRKDSEFSVKLLRLLEVFTG